MIIFFLRNKLLKLFVHKIKTKTILQHFKSDELRFTFTNKFTNLSRKHSDLCKIWGYSVNLITRIWLSHWRQGRQNPSLLIIICIPWYGPIYIAYDFAPMTALGVNRYISIVMRLQHRYNDPQRHWWAFRINWFYLIFQTIILRTRDDLHCNRHESTVSTYTNIRMTIFRLLLL